MACERKTRTSWSEAMALLTCVIYTGVGWAGVGWAGVVLAGAGLGGCSSPAYPEDTYACTPGVSGTCPTGWVCRWSAAGGEDRCFRADVADDDGGAGPTCGDGVLEGTELCDGDDLGGKTCASINLGTGALACDVTCQLDTSGCSLTAVCGNGAIEGNETCEGLNLNGQSCTSIGQGFTGGTLGCDEITCTFDTTACTPGGCVDNDGDSYGAGCSLGEDCDDTAPGITGPCQANGCPVGWLLVPAGDFPMGCDSGDLGGTCNADEQPLHMVTLGAYCIEETEVSVAAYRACHSTGACSGAPQTSGDDDLCNWETDPGDREGHPVNCISASDAQEYCRDWLGGDLPTEAEWEKAARGVDQRKYPWGDLPDPVCTHCNFDVNGTGFGVGCASVEVGPGTWPVGDLVSGDGDSPYALRDMAGNVWEWMQDFYDPGFYDRCAAGCTDPVNTDPGTGTRVVRGGGFIQSPAEVFRTVNRLGIDPAVGIPAVGFRCRWYP